MKQFWRWYAVYVLVLLAIFCITVHFCSQPESQSQAIGSIVNKYEADGKYFVEIQAKITADEYIGYDIGDNYSIKEVSHNGIKD